MTLTSRFSLAVCASLLASAIVAAPSATTQKTFDTPEKACAALIAASDPFDPAALKDILGPEGVDLVATEDAVQDKNQSAAFAASAREKTKVTRDAKNRSAERKTSSTDGSSVWR